MERSFKVAIGNNSREAPFTWTWQETLTSIPLALIVLGAIAGNLVVLYCFLTRPRTLRQPTHYIIANLAVADFLVGVLVMPFLATLQVTGRWYFGPVYCECWTAIHFILCSASILSTVAVCIERYVGVRHPLKHRKIMSFRRICGLNICVWLLASTLALTSLYIWPEPRKGNPYECEINHQIGHVVVAVVGILYVPALVMIILYWRIYKVAIQHLKFMKQHSVTVASIESNRKNSSPMPTIREDEATISEMSLSTSISTSSGSDSPETPSKLKHSETGSYTKFNDQKKGSGVSTKSSSESVAPSSISSSTSSWNVALVKNVQRKKQIDLAVKLCTLVGILLISYLPFFSLYLTMAFRPNSIDMRVFNAFGWVRYFNSCFNPFIYAFAVPAYRRAMKEVFQNVFRVLSCASR